MKTIKEGIRHCIECLKYLSNYPPYEPESVEHGFVQGVAFAQEWISVEDELPESPQFVIVHKKNGVECGMFFDFKKRFMYGPEDQTSQIASWRPIVRK